MPRSTPTFSSPVADAHRQSGPAARARAPASSGPGGCLSQTPPLANPDSSSSRSLAAPSVPSSASHGPKTLSPSPAVPASGSASAEPEAPEASASASVPEAEAPDAGSGSAEPATPEAPELEGPGEVRSAGRPASAGLG